MEEFDEARQYRKDEWQRGKSLMTITEERLPSNKLPHLAGTLTEEVDKDIVRILNDVNRLKKINRKIGDSP